MVSRISERDEGTAGSPAAELRTVARAVDVLKAFQRADAWSVSALARDLGLHKSVTHRLLATLARGGLLVQDRTTGHYALSMVVASLARRVERRTTLAAAARPHLLALADACRETVSLVVPNGNTGLCLDTVESTQSMRLTVTIGEAFLLHAGAAGKLLLAFQPPEVIARVASASPLPRYTDRTLTSEAALRRALAEVRRTGVATSDGEITPGARSLGAPVWNHEGRVVAGLVISAPAFRLGPPDARRLRPLLIATAERVSAALGYTGRYPWTPTEDAPDAAES